MTGDVSNCSSSANIGQDVPGVEKSRPQNTETSWCLLLLHSEVSPPESIKYIRIRKGVDAREQDGDYRARG